MQNKLNIKQIITWFIFHIASKPLYLCSWFCISYHTSQCQILFLSYFNFWIMSISLYFNWRWWSWKSQEKKKCFSIKALWYIFFLCLVFDQLKKLFTTILFITMMEKCVLSFIFSIYLVCSQWVLKFVKGGLIFAIQLLEHQLFSESFLVTNELFSKWFGSITNSNMNCNG